MVQKVNGQKISTLNNVLKEMFIKNSYIKCTHNTAVLDSTSTHDKQKESQF